MSGLPRFHFVQERGRWVAHCKDVSCMDVLGTSTVPVMRDFQDGQWSGGTPPRHFNANPDQFHMAWWTSSRQKLWRELLLSGMPILLRQATKPTEDAPTGSVSRKLGIFRTKNVRIEDSRMTLELAEQLAEAT